MTLNDVSATQLAEAEPPRPPEIPTSATDAVAVAQTVATHTVWIRSRARHAHAARHTRSQARVLTRWSGCLRSWVYSEREIRFPANSNASCGRFATLDFKRSYDFSLNDIHGRSRTIVWMMVGSFITLAAIACVVSARLSQFGHEWHRGRSGWQADRPGQSGTVAANTESDADAILLAALERRERQMAAAIAKARESVVALEYTAPDAPPGTRRVATGVVINNGGEVLSVRIDPPPASQASVMAANSSRIVAHDFSGRRHSVHWVAADPETGLTLLRVAPRAVRPIRSASGSPNLGSQVFVVGNPFGMGHSVSRGHVAGLDRALELGTRQLGGLIQVQAPLYPGDSGAAVVNLHGDWLGLIRSGLAIPGSDPDSESNPGAPVTPTTSSTGLSPSLAPTDVSLGRPERDTHFGFAIPVQDAVWVADQLRTGTGVDRAYLGVRLEPIPAYRHPGDLKVRATARSDINHSGIGDGARIDFRRPRKCNGQRSRWGDPPRGAGRHAGFASRAAARRQHC